MNALANIPVDMIEPGQRLRQISEAQVETLVASIGDVGLLNPITVYSRQIIQSGVYVDGYGLVAGAHRLEAFKRLGLVEISAQIVTLSDLERQIAECDENLCSTKLTPSEKAMFTKRRKEAYEALHPETKAGVAGAHGSNRAQGNASAKFAPAFTADTAAKTGESERAVQLNAERGKKISEKALATLQGTALDKGAYLDELKTVPVAEQVSRVKADLQAQKGIARRFKPTAAPVHEEESREKWLAAGMSWWNRAPQEWRDEFLSRVDAPVEHRSAA